MPRWGRNQACPCGGGGAQERPEAFHGVDVDFMEAIAVPRDEGPRACFVTGVFALAVADGLVLVAPDRQAIVDVILIRIKLRTFRYDLLDYRFDRLLLDIGQHVENDLSASLDQSEDGRFLLFQSAAARRSLEPPAASLAAFFWVATGSPLCPATT